MQTRSKTKNPKGSNITLDQKVCSLNLVDRKFISEELSLLYESFTDPETAKQFDYTQHDPIQTQFLSAIHIHRRRTGNNLNYVAQRFTDILIRITEHMMLTPSQSHRMDLMEDMRFIREEISFIQELQSVKI